MLARPLSLARALARSLARSWLARLLLARALARSLATRGEGAWRPPGSARRPPSSEGAGGLRGGNAAQLGIRGSNAPPVA